MSELNTSRWVSWGSSGGHNGEYNYDCTICGKSDWIPHYGKVEDLQCDCTRKLKIHKENMPTIKEYVDQNFQKIETKDDIMKVTIKKAPKLVKYFDDLRIGQIFRFKTYESIHIKISSTQYISLNTKDINILPDFRRTNQVEMFDIETIELIEI